jgi:hypothetical protein
MINITLKIQIREKLAFPAHGVSKNKADKIAAS